MSTCGKQDSAGRKGEDWGEELGRLGIPLTAAKLPPSPPSRQHVRQEEGQEFKDNMDQLFEDVRLWELQGDEGGVGGEGGAQGEASLCRSCLRPTGQVASRKTMGQLYCHYSF